MVDKTCNTSSKSRTLITPRQPEARLIVTVASLAILSVALGAPYVAIVALKAIAADFGGYRSTPSAAASLAMLGTGVGGLGMGWLAERVGVKRVVCLGACMVCAGLALSSVGEVWQLYVGHGLLIGLLGNGAINAPLYVYVTRWFEAAAARRSRSCPGGQYVAGASLPPLFERRSLPMAGARPCSAWSRRRRVVVPLALLFCAGRRRRPKPVPRKRVRNATRCWGCRPTSPSVSSPAPPFCAACRWPCRPRI